MRFVTVRDLRGKSAQVWRQLGQERDMVITSKGKPIALLTSINEENVEESLEAIRTARAMAAVEAMQRRSERMGGNRMTLKEISAIIADVRRSRKQGVRPCAS